MAPCPHEASISKRQAIKKKLISEVIANSEVCRAGHYDEEHLEHGVCVSLGGQGSSERPVWDLSKRKEIGMYKLQREMVLSSWQFRRQKKMTVVARMKS